MGVSFGFFPVHRPRIGAQGVLRVALGRFLVVLFDVSSVRGRDSREV